MPTRHPRSMADNHGLSDAGFTYEDEFDYLFAYTSPNPSREGCPPRDVFLAMYRRELPIGDDRYLHVVRCSPCFRELRVLQQARTRLRRRRWSLFTGLATIAAALWALGALWRMA